MSLNVLVLYYSRDGSTKKLAELMARGVESVDGVEAIIRTVPNVSQNTEQTEQAIPDSGATYCTYDELEACDALCLGSPTRFGNMAGSLKYFLDGTTSQWLSGALQGKPACVFTSTGSLHGGQETTLLSMMIPLFHHGMLMVGLPYDEALLGTKTGGTPYGVSHYAGAKGDFAISDEEAQMAKTQGKRIAEITKRLKQGA